MATQTGPTFRTQKEAMRVLIVAGEASGDLYGADLARHLQAKHPTLELFGVGGVRMQQAGVQLLADSQRWGAIGVVESLRVLPAVLRAFGQLKCSMRRLLPDLLIPIDFGAFNVPLCRWAKQRGFKVCYYMPPGSWRRDAQGRDLPAITDWILTPFPWSAQRLQAMGATAVRIRHPLLRLARPAMPQSAFCERLGLDPDRPIVALLPGSRRHEVVAHTPLYARVAELVNARLPEVQFVLSVAPGVPTDWVHRLWAEGSRNWVPTETRPVWDMLAYADVAIVCSGTATLEAALLGTPMLIVYRGSNLMNLEYRLRRRRLALRHIGLPNLLLEREVCPELIQEEAVPSQLTHHLITLLQQDESYRRQKEAFEQIRRLLGEGETLSEGPEWIEQHLIASTPAPTD
ncbi:MAG: lipid-A-disaccharide synthase [Fimbriimonadales bacterium]|nr:lipid-A-disaccharide synthase [Fimbriimonadales bacterium]